METNVLDWLEVTAAACPDKPAFLDEDSAVTFADVRREARIIGTAAAKFRAGQKRPIAVMSGRNAHTPAVFLGAVYAGCCYAPMDGTMPVHRLNSILNTLDTDLMIVQRAFYDKAKTLDFSGTILIAEELLAGSEDAALLADCRARARELDPLYIIFTSGSTGTPKGVITAQHSLMCYIEDYAGVMGIAREDVLGNQSPLDYIAAVRDIYLPLRFGATTAIIPKELFMSPERLFEYMNDKGVTAVGWSVSALTVPAALGAFECSVPQHLRKVCFSGSVMPCSCLRQWQLALPEARFVNQYGPTEATASCTYYVVPGLVEDTDVLPIGRPYPHYEVFLLSERNEAVPDGEIGELVMTCLCRQGMPILRYRTRDLTRFLPGECSCGRHHRRIDRILGRADDMFIIKGVNVYPMQIEQVIMTFPEVGQNYCILLENDGIGDVMRVQVEIRDEYFVEDMRCLQGLQKTIAQRLRDEILVTPRVELVQSNSLPSSEGKAVRVYDNRVKK